MFYKQKFKRVNNFKSAHISEFWKQENIKTKNDKINFTTQKIRKCQCGKNIIVAAASCLELSNNVPLEGSHPTILFYSTPSYNTKNKVRNIRYGTFNAFKYLKYMKRIFKTSVSIPVKEQKWCLKMTIVFLIVCIFSSNIIFFHGREDAVDSTLRIHASKNVIQILQTTNRYIGIVKKSR